MRSMTRTDTTTAMRIMSTITMRTRRRPRTQDTRRTVITTPRMRRPKATVAITRTRARCRC